MDLTAFSKALAATSASLWVQEQAWVIPAVQSIHILALAVIMASSGMLNLRLAGFIGRDEELRGTARRFLPWIWWALPVQLVTGIILIVGEPARELLSWAFWLKMAMLAAVIVITVPLQRALEDAPYRDMAPAKRAAVRGAALAGLVLWLGIVTCGRWIAYVQ